MNFKKLILTFSIGISCWGFVQINCEAVSVREKYGELFETRCAESEVIVENTGAEEKRELISLMNDGSGLFNVELLDEPNDKILDLTIKDKEKHTLGSISLIEQSDENKLEVMYWIGGNYRRKGYASLATYYVISKIWERYEVSFIFNIDGENVASLRTLQRVCSMLGNVDFSLLETHVAEIRFLKLKYDGQKFIYNVTSYYDGELQSNQDIEEDKLLNIYPKEVLENEEKLTYVGNIYEVKAKS